MKQVVGNYEYTPNEHNFLGKGQFAQVYRGNLKSSHEIVAVKINSTAKLNDKEKSYLKTEIQLLGWLSQHPHPNVIGVKFIQERWERSEVVFVLDFIAGGTLKTYLASQPPNKRNLKVLKEDTARAFMIQLASGLKFLHHAGIVHRDLKPDNILLSEKSPNAMIKICDFGFSKMTKDVENDLLLSMVGSPIYMSPELLKRGRNGMAYSSKSDLWSMGCIYFEMIFGSYSLGMPKDLDDLYKRATSSSEVILPDNNFVTFSDEGRDLMIKLLQKTDKSRISWKSFFAHPYLNPTPKIPQEKLTRSFQKSLLRQNYTPLSEKIPSEASWIQKVDYFVTGRSNLCVKKYQTIFSLKQALEKNSGISAQKQMLLLTNGTLLVDRMLLADYTLDHRTVLYLISSDFLNVKNMDPLVKKLCSTKLSSTMIDATPKRVPSRQDGFLDENVRSYFAAVLENKSNVESIYGRFMKSYKPIHSFEEQITILRDSYSACWEHCEKQYTSYETRFKLNNVFSSLKDLARTLIANKSMTLFQLKQTIVHKNIGNGSLLELISPLFNYEAKYTDLSNLCVALENSITSFANLEKQIQTYKSQKIEVIGWIEKNFTIFGIINSEKRAVTKFYEDFVALEKNVSELKASAKKFTLPQLREQKAWKDYSLSASQLVAQIKNKLESAYLNGEIRKINEIKDRQFVEFVTTFLKNFSVVGDLLKKFESSEYEKQTVLFQNALNECNAFANIYSSYDQWLGEVVRRAEYMQIIKQANELLKQESDSENKHRVDFEYMVDDFKRNCPDSAVIAFFPNNAILSPIKIKEFDDDKDLPQIKQEELPSSFPTKPGSVESQTERLVAQIKQFLNDSRQTKSSKMKELLEFQEVINKVSEIGQKKELLAAEDQKIGTISEELRKHELNLEELKQSVKTKETSLRESKASFYECHQEVSNSDAIPIKKMESGALLVKTLEDMGFSRLQCLRLLQNNPSLTINDAERAVAMLVG